MNALRTLWLCLAWLPIFAWADPSIPIGPDHCILSRDSHGKIARSRASLKAFVKVHACPATGLHSTHCPGYVLDHLRPLCSCGKDEPSNMQWQELKESHRKDRREDALCARLKRLGYVK